MSVRIDNITRGRFGNKILQYNSLRQIANNYNIEPSCCNFSESKYFKNIISKKEIPKNKKKELLFCKKVIDGENLDFDNKYYTVDDPAYCLHNTFFQITTKDPREFLELKDEYKPKFDSNYLHIGIHLRGGDVIPADNGKEIHEFLYYKDSIDYVLENYKDKDLIFYICTDDKTFKSFKLILNYVKEKKLNFKLGNINSYIHDFGILSECDILINSSSTFCVSAGFLGKKDKFIIHSKKWLERNIKHLPWNKNSNDIFIRGGIKFNIKMKEYWETFDNFWIKSLEKNDFYYISILK